MPTNRTESVEVWLRGQYSFSNPASRTETLFARSPNVSKLVGSFGPAFFICAKQMTFSLTARYKIYKAQAVPNFISAQKSMICLQKLL